MPLTFGKWNRGPSDSLEEVNKRNSVNNRISATARIIAIERNLPIPRNAADRLTWKRAQSLGWGSDDITFVFSEAKRRAGIAKDFKYGIPDAKPTKFGSRAAQVKRPRISGPNPTLVGRERELSMLEVLAAIPGHRVVDVANAVPTKGYDAELYRLDDGELASVWDSSADKTLQEFEYQTMLELHKKNKEYYIYLPTGKKLLVTPETPYQIGSRKF